MRNIPYLAAFKCSVKHFKSSSIKGVSLIDILNTHGVDMSGIENNEDLGYVANFTKGRAGRPSFILEPDSKHIQVMEVFDPFTFLFFVLQTNSHSIQIGEFFVHNGKVEQAKNITKDTVNSFPVKECRKAGLVDIFKLHKRNTTDKSIADKIEIEQNVSDLLNVAHEKDDANKSVVSHSMSLDEILSAMIHARSVYIGSYYSPLYCGQIYPCVILGITKDKVLIDCEITESCSHDELFSSVSKYGMYLSGIKD